MKVVCLASGGIDSTIILFMLKKENHKIFPLYIDYGHKSASMEKKSLEKICEQLTVKLKFFELKDLSSIYSGLTDPAISPLENPYFPNRNLLFLTIASAYAYQNSIKIISIGLIDNVIFPDQTKKFVKGAKESISTSLGYNIKILAPLMELDKREVIGLAKLHQIPLKLTYSCYVGNKEHCGKCKACQERDLAINDPVT